jgi:predicted metal-dependent phosphoesterase TrpH
VRAFVDLHCHTRASFDSLSHPRDVVAAAAKRGMTHLAITDHDRIDGALAARDLAPAGLSILVGEEIWTTEGDLVGVPHPFDRLRNSLARDEGLAAIAGLVDWIEVHNSRLVGGGNARAAEFAVAHGLPGVAVSDAHTILEVAVSSTVLDGDPSTPDGLRAALPGGQLVMSRASYLVRLWTPVAKVVQRSRGNGRVPVAVREGDGDRAG